MVGQTVSTIPEQMDQPPEASLTNLFDQVEKVCGGVNLLSDVVTGYVDHHPAVDAVNLPFHFLPLATSFHSRRSEWSRWRPHTTSV